MGNDTNNRVISVLFSRPLLTPVIYTVTDRDTSCVQITLMMHCDYFFPQLGSWRKAVWFKHFFIFGSSLSGSTDRSTDTGDTRHLINAEVTNLVSCPILFTSVFCHHDTSELLCHQRFVFRGSSGHYQVPRIHFGSAMIVCPSPPRCDCKGLRVPCTAISLVSWMRVLPPATCTVTVFIPSAVNMYEMLLSKVMRGCRRQTQMSTSKSG